MKTTTAHFKIFKAECEKWIKVWGLLDYSIEYEHEDCEGDLARCATHYRGKCALISLGAEWADPISTHSLKKVAFHEVAELLLMELNHFMGSRFITEEGIENATHTMVRRLENVVFEGK